MPYKCVSCEFEDVPLDYPYQVNPLTMATETFTCDNCGRNTRHVHIHSDGHISDKQTPTVEA